MRFFYKYSILFVCFTLLLCSGESEIPTATDAGTASVSGRVLYPDTGTNVYLISNDGIDSTTCFPETGYFIFDSLSYGLHVLQVRADGFALFEQKLILNQREFVFHDISLRQNLVQVIAVEPVNSTFLDSSYFALYPRMKNDSGINVYINFRETIDTTSVNEALSILPDSGNMKIYWMLGNTLAFFVPYRKLAENERLQIKINTHAIDIYGDTLLHDFSIFYPVATGYFRGLSEGNP